MCFVIGMITGCILGAMVIASMKVSGDCSRIEEAYRKGFEDGRATKNIT